MGNLASAVDELLAVDITEQPTVAVMDDVVEIRRQVNRLEAAYLARLEVVDRSGVPSQRCGSTAAWLRAECHTSPSVAFRDVRLSRDLADVLPSTRAALADGEVTVGHAQLIASLRLRVGDEALTAAEPHVVEFARQASTTELRGVIAHVAHSYAPARFAAGEAEDFADRRVHASTTMHGVGVGDWQLHPAGHELVMTALNAASRPVQGDDRTPAQRRADALVTIAEIALRAGELPVTGGVKPHVTVHVTVPTLRGDDRAPGADLASGAVIGTETARRLSCDAEITRVVFAAAGEVLDSGRASRVFTAAQARAIVARDRHCVWPGCDAPPGWCDVHHRQHWAHGGRTSVDNGVLMCGAHHDRIHHTKAVIVNGADGHYTVRIDGVSHPTRSDGCDQRAGP